jgi:hypothetical protein
MVDKAGWHDVKNRSRAHAEIAHDEGVGRGCLHTIANGLAPRILEFLSHDRRNLPPRTPQRAVKDRPAEIPSASLWQRTESFALNEWDASHFVNC